MVKNFNFIFLGLDFVVFLCSCVCYDVILLVGVINNGLELLDEGGVDVDVMDFICISVFNVLVCLKFVCFVFGVFGLVGVLIDIGEVEKVVKDFVVVEKKMEVIWLGLCVIVVKNCVKLLMNFFLFVYGLILCGGQVDVVLENLEYDVKFKLMVKGCMMCILVKFIELYIGEVQEVIDVYFIQFYYMLFFVDECGMVLKVEVIGEEIIFMVEMVV